MPEQFPPIPKEIKKAIINYFSHVRDAGVKVIKVDIDVTEDNPGVKVIDVTEDNQFKSMSVIAPDFADGVNRFSVDDTFIFVRLIEFADGFKTMVTDIRQRVNKHGDKYYGVTRELYESNQENIGWLMKFVDG
jgi:hypothetical protein